MDIDKITSFRKNQQEEKRRKEEMEALQNVSSSVKQSAYETKKQLESVTKNIAKSSDIDEVIRQLKESQLASYLSSSQKSQIILADSTELGEAVAGLGTKLDTLATSLKDEKTDNKLIQAVKEEFGKVIEIINRDTDTELIKAIQDLRPLIEKINVQPVVVPPPNVTVESPKVDLKPLKESIDKHFAPKETGIDLSIYKAQDISGDDVYQYVGFVAPNGEWYIIENDIDGGSLRYYFGKKNYSSNWKNHMGLNYKLLNEAINAIQT